MKVGDRNWRVRDPTGQAQRQCYTAIDTVSHDVGTLISPNSIFKAILPLMEKKKRKIHPRLSSESSPAHDTYYICTTTVRSSHRLNCYKCPSTINNHEYAILQLVWVQQIPSPRPEKLEFLSSAGTKVEVHSRLRRDVTSWPASLDTSSLPILSSYHRLR